MADYIYRKITKRVKDTIHHRFYDKKDNQINDKSYIKKICEGIYIPCLLYTSPSPRDEL